MMKRPVWVECSLSILDSVATSVVGFQICSGLLIVIFLQRHTSFWFQEFHPAIKIAAIASSAKAVAGALILSQGPVGIAL